MTGDAARTKYELMSEQMTSPKELAALMLQFFPEMLDAATPF
jgi:hypothetical protein